MLELKSVTPVYFALIESVPTGNVVDVRVATPFASVAVPRTVLPFMNITLPEGVVPDTAEVTVAVNVTDFPKTDGLSDELTLVVVASALTTSERGAEVLALKPVTPV